MNRSSPAWPEAAQLPLGLREHTVSVSTSIACPVCEQGSVRAYRQDNGDLLLWVCAECDSAWLSWEAIARDSSGRVCR